MYTFIIIILSCFFILVVNEESRDKMYYGLFGLSSNDTVMDYKTASFDKQLYWENKACSDGKCLFYIDWKCGFENGNQSLVKGCFIDLIKVSKPQTTLDEIRKTCGRKYMKFVGELNSKKKECMGKWGAVN